MGLAEDLWLRKSNVITYSPPNVDPTTLDNFLTDWAIHVTNEAIWQCNGLELDAMDPLVAIIHHSLSFTGFRNRSYSAVYETKAVI